MFVTSETEVNDPALATSLGDRHHPGLGLQVAKRFPATRGIAELSPDARYKRSTFCARQCPGDLGRRARVEKTFHLVLITLRRFDRRSELFDKNSYPLGFGSDHVLRHRQLGSLKLIPQLLTARFAQVMLLSRKAVEFFTFKHCQMGRGGVASEKIQGNLRLNIFKRFQRPRVISLSVMVS